MSAFGLSENNDDRSKRRKTDRFRSTGSVPGGSKRREIDPGYSFNLVNLRNAFFQVSPYTPNGRILGVVFVGGKIVNIEIVKEGLAEVYRGPPANGLDFEPYCKAEAESKEEMFKIWSLDNKYVSPKEWRKMDK